MSRKKRNARQHKNVHHIFCQSTHPQLKNADWNKVKIDRRLHDLYHQLFINRSPQEILNFLCEYFWGGKIEVTEVHDANT